MSRVTGIRIALLAVAAIAFFSASCPKKELFKPPSQTKQAVSHYEIIQPNTNYPNDEVIIWQTPDLGQRAFLLKPKTKVELVKSQDNSEGKTVYQIKTADDRTGWVPNTHCKPVYK